MFYRDDREDADDVDCGISALRRGNDEGVAIASGVGREQRSGQAVVTALRDQLATHLVDPRIGDEIGKYIDGINSFEEDVDTKNF